MKKLMLTALMACSLVAFADEPAAKPAAEAPAKPATVERAKLSPEQRKAFHERMMAQRKARMAEIQTKVVDALKEAGLAEDKAKETAEKIEKIYMEGRGGFGRRPMPPHGRGPRHAKPAAEQK